MLDLGDDLATLCNLGSLLHLLLLHFLTLVHPFHLLFFLLERECEGNEGRVSGAEVQVVGKYLPFMLTCGTCPLIDDSSFPLNLQSLHFHRMVR